MTVIGYIGLALLGVAALVLLYRAAREWDTEQSNSLRRRETR